MKYKDIKDNINSLRNHKAVDWLILLVIVLMVVTIGMFLVNEASEFIYNTKLLSSPCSLCEELNPHIECESVASSVQFAINQ